ncbi:hypothetical protein [Nocardioides sp. 616]|uniref:hypothetical protein n=1 Tax=Nocardioides sp. 616 TaxID=2268090 RepID=UPI000CE302F1|nr:hypothetical protein [Nocardioides sp. 616]
MAVVLIVLLAGWAIPSTATAIPGFSDCKDSPTPELPGRGMAGFFSGEPDVLPPAGDPFAPNAETTIFEQYGYAGLRWNTYDLGCGPDAMRQPDAVIGTAVSNWLVQLPIALTALTGSVTQAAFEPNFLGAFDSSVEDVSTALHENLFASWIPFVFAALGILLIFKARRASMATSAAAVGWALIVVLIASALFKWPVEAGSAADRTVTGTLGAAVSNLDGSGADIDPGTALASGINEAILYRAWLAGTLGSADTETAEKYGPALFQAHALTWREAQILEDDPERGNLIIEAKKEQWKTTAETIENEDPEAYEYLTGERSDTRVGYAILSTLGVFLALPFLLMSSLLLIGCFLIVRLAVMLFPAFATLGAFPASRGLVTGLGRTVGAAVINSIVFGIGAGVTIAVLGILMQPGGEAPTWLGIVLMPLFSVIMWVALKPFRRLTSMVSPNDSFIGGVDRPSWLKRAALTGLTAVTSGTAAGVAAAVVTKDDDSEAPPERAEARPSQYPQERPRPPVEAAVGPRSEALALTPRAAARPSDDASAGPGPSAPSGPRPQGPAPAGGGSSPAEEPGFTPAPVGDNLQPANHHEYDGDEVYVIYRPGDGPTQATA